VSPVIGVVLMVAITVILAAAIGSSVFGQGPSESAPQANINIIAVNESAIKLEHLGGDTILFDSSSNNTRIAFSSEDESFDIDIAQFTGDGMYFDVGDTQILRLTEDSSATPIVYNNQTGGQFATVKIVDSKTKQLVADKELRF
jgi:flagellin-like protein